MMPTNTLDVVVRRRIHPGLEVAVSLQLGAELGVLFGPSGAGKTSTLQMIAGLLTPEHGSIRVGDRVLFDQGRRYACKLRKRRVGYVFQHDVLFPHLDVGQNLRYGLHDWAPAAARARVAEIADLCGVESLLRRRVQTLSGGERQRVGLARAIAPRPELLLCDEPVSALDIDARYRLLSRLRQVQRSAAIPILLVTHAVDEALTFGDRLFVLEAGRITLDGRPEAVLAELARRAYLNSSRLQNIFAGVVLDHDPTSQATRLALDGGPTLIIPLIDRPLGASVLVRIDSEEIVLARGELGPLSARNRIAGTIEQILRHGNVADVAVRVGDLTWMVGIIAPTIGALDLKMGDRVELIIKARSCRPLLDHPS